MIEEDFQKIRSIAQELAQQAEDAMLMSKGGAEVSESPIDIKSS